MFKKSSQNSRLLRFLKTGRDISANQAYDKFGIQNMTARVNDLRKAGYAVYLNERRTRSGNTMKVYRLGTPRRSVVAAGHLVNTDPSFYFIDGKIRDNLRLVK